MNADEIKRFFDDYQATLAEVERLDILVRTQHDWDAWKQALTDRADYLHNEYDRMKEAIRQSLDVFRADTPALDDAAWTQFRLSLRECYAADAHDLAVIGVRRRCNPEKAFRPRAQGRADCDDRARLCRKGRFLKLDGGHVSGAHQPNRLRIRARPDDRLRMLENHPRFLYADARHDESGRNRRDFLLCDVSGFHARLPRRGGYAARGKAPVFQGISARAFITDYNKRSCDAYTLNSALEQLAFLPQSYKLFDTPEEKIDFMFRMVIVRHCTTFLHSQMVSTFAQTILAAILDHAPEILVGYRDFKTADDVRAHRAALLQFIEDAALLHDVGKNAMLTIIETQHRPLSDDEFAIIRNHPSKGAEYLSIDPDLARFKDITNGHHKFYNGKGGYPADFDNTASPERILIDIITLCDCLDAATDCYGRNYHQAKTVRQVLAEFERDSGVRYNPDIVRFLCDSPELDEQLQTIAGEKRLEIYYQTYQKYFM